MASTVTDVPFIATLSELESVLLDRIPLESRSTFLQPPHPTQLSEQDHGITQQSLSAAQKLLQEAQTNNARVLIYGDYDCDGVTATALLWEVLYHHWKLKVTPFLPHREKHGYGLNVSALKEIFAEQRYDLVITVDNGIVANEAFAWLREQGVATILTDHHEANGELPDADVILHSTQLCGASVAWLLASYLQPDVAEAQLDYAVLGTLADQVPLFGANRSFAWHGMKALQHSSRKSLQQLAQLASKDLSAADEWLVHYIIAPRINAMGRLDSPLPALRALVARQPSKIQELLITLEETNKQRQVLTQEAMAQAESQVVTQLNEPCIVIVGEFHEGIIGLVAGKITEQYQRPSIVISTKRDLAKGSCRSVPGQHITAFLRQLESIEWLSLGGHAQAAGFSVSSKDVTKLHTVIQHSAAKTWALPTTTKKLQPTAQLDPSLLTAQTVKALQRFAPFGSGNEPPLFTLTADIERVRWVGKQKEHAQVVLRFPGTQLASLTGICFRAQDKVSAECSGTHNVILEVRPSTYPGKTLELIIHSCEPVATI